MTTVTIYLLGGHTLTWRCSPAQARELVEGYDRACQSRHVVGTWRLGDGDGSGIERTVRAREVVAIQTRASA